MLGTVLVDAQTFVNFGVEVLQEGAPCRVEACLDLRIQLPLQGVERLLNLLLCPAVLVDCRDAHLQIHARLDCAEHFVAGAEDAAEEIELLVQQLEDTPIGLVGAIEEVHH